MPVKLINSPSDNASLKSKKEKKVRFAIQHRLRSLPEQYLVFAVERIAVSRSSLTINAHPSASKCSVITSGYNDTRTSESELFAGVYQGLAGEH